jgi:hypothetical protein
VQCVLLLREVFFEAMDGKFFFLLMWSVP